MRAADDLEDAFAWKEERTLSRTVTLQGDEVIFILEPERTGKAAIDNRAAFIELVICHNGVALAYRTFDKSRQIDQDAISDNNQLGPVLAMPRDQQPRREPETPQHESAAPTRSARRPPIRGRQSFAKSRASWRSLVDNG